MAAATFDLAIKAIDAADLGQLGQLIDEDPQLVHRRSEREDPPYDGYFRHATLLHHCAGNPSRAPMPETITAVVQLLLDRGAEVDAVTEFHDDWSWTTLGLVASSGPASEHGLAEPLIDQLLDAGADINFNNGLNLYGAFIHSGNCPALGEVATMLLKRGAQLDLGYAAALGEIEAIDYYADHPESYSRYRPKRNRMQSPTRQQQLDEALVIAAMSSRVDSIDRLLHWGANLSGTAPIHAEQPAALHAAIWTGSLTTVQALIERGADPRQRDTTHDTSATGWAEYLGHSAIHDYLRRVEAEI